MKIQSQFHFLTLVTTIAVILAADARAQSGSRNYAPRRDSVSASVDAGVSASVDAGVTDGAAGPAAPSPASPSDILADVSQPTYPPENLGQIQSESSSDLVDPVFGISTPGSTETVDHSSWDYFLARYAVTDEVCLTRVHYGKVCCSDRKLLRQYLRRLQNTDVRNLSLNHQMAFWFNLYNAKVVDLMLQHYPIRSIRLIKQDLFDFVGPFDDPGAVKVLGVSLSLNDVESGIIRPLFQDPRIHYAVNCASLGCPNLARQAWSADDIDRQLDQAACRFVNSGRAVKDGVCGLRLSRIYKWYKEDFGGSDQAIIRHLCRYANRETRAMLRGEDSIAGYFYDWSLNDAKRCRPRLLEPLRL